MNRTGNNEEVINTDRERQTEVEPVTKTELNKNREYENQADLSAECILLNRDKGQYIYLSASHQNYIKPFLQHPERHP